MLSFSVPPGHRPSRSPARPKLHPFVGIIERILEEDRGRPPKPGHFSEGFCLRRVQPRAGSRQGRLHVHPRRRHPDGSPAWISGSSTAPNVSDSAADKARLYQYRPPKPGLLSRRRLRLNQKDDAVPEALCEIAWKAQTRYARRSSANVARNQEIVIDPSASRTGNGKPSRSKVARIAASTASPPMAVPPLFSIV